MRAAANGETYQERTKGKDVRTSNIVAAKVRPLPVLLRFPRGGTNAVSCPHVVLTP